jgi:hypothetical protein
MNIDPNDQIVDGLADDFPCLARQGYATIPDATQIASERHATAGAARLQAEAAALRLRRWRMESPDEREGVALRPVVEHVNLAQPGIRAVDPAGAGALLQEAEAVVDEAIKLHPTGFHPSANCMRPGPDITAFMAMDSADNADLRPMKKKYQDAARAVFEPPDEPGVAQGYQPRLVFRATRAGARFAPKGVVVSIGQVGDPHPVDALNRRIELLEAKLLAAARAVSEVTGGGEHDGTDEDRPATLPRAAHIAYQEFTTTIQKSPELADGTDREVYDRLSAQAERKLPTFATWSRHLRRGRAHFSDRKHNQRAGRTGRNVKRQDEL